MPDPPKDYDAGLLGDGGRGDVAWWQDYIRVLLRQANEQWRAEYDALSEQRDGLQAEIDRLDAYVHDVGDDTGTVDAAIAEIERVEEQRDGLLTAAANADFILGAILSGLLKDEQDNGYVRMASVVEERAREMRGGLQAAIAAAEKEPTDGKVSEV